MKSLPFRIAGEGGFYLQESCIYIINSVLRPVIQVKRPIFIHIFFVFIAFLHKFNDEWFNTIDRNKRFVKIKYHLSRRALPMGKENNF